MRVLKSVCFIFIAVSCLYAKKWEFDYGYPFYSPISKQDNIKVTTERCQFEAGILFEPVPFLLAGPRLGWTAWNMTFEGQSDLKYSISKFAFSYVIRPRKQICKNTWLFFEASGSLEHFDFSLGIPNGIYSPILSTSLDKNEWGAGHSLGVGIELFHITASINHDAHLTESIGNELSGLRLQFGVWF